MSDLTDEQRERLAEHMPGDNSRLYAVVADLIAEAEQRGAEKALREAAEAARGMHDPVAPDCTEWATWMDARADREARP